MSETIIVKLVNDTTLIGKLSEEDDNCINLTEALRLDVMYNSRNPSVYFYEWDDLSAQNNVWLDKFHILYITEPKEKVLQFYNDQLSGLKKPVQEQSQDGETEAIIAYMERIASANTTLN